MNITLRKMAMLEKQFQAQEEYERLNGFMTSSVDKDLKNRITKIMDKIRVL